MADDTESGKKGRPIPSETRCGVLSWRPGCLQVFANVKAYTATVALITIFGSMNFSYYTAVITQIEKQFGLSSSMMGFLKNVDNIGYLSAVLLVSHFCRYANKPRLFSGATIAIAFSVALFAMPHFFFGAKLTPGTDTGNSTNPNRTSTPIMESLCRETSADDTEMDRCNRRTFLAPFNAGAFAVFILSELLQGVSSTPKGALSMTYLDDNAGRNTPKYLGFLFAARSFSPMLGFLLGAWATSKYVDLSETTLTPRDPRWVGAWWLGFLICAACALVWAVPLALFPPVLKEQKEKLESGQIQEQPTITDTMKDLPRAIGRLATNKIYVICLMALAFEVNMMGVATFLPKYFEKHFRQTPGMASLISGCIFASAFTLGPIIAGRITAKVNPNPHYFLRVCAGLALTTGSLYAVLMSLGCDQDDYAANLEIGSFNVTAECNSGCGCDDFDYQPVCGVDGRTYFSPCHAGCTDVFKNETFGKVFTSCRCVAGGQARLGVCQTQCKMLIPYACVLFLVYFIGSMGSIPMLTTFMRAVSEKDKAIGLGGATFTMSIASFPAPLLVGLVIDSTCLVEQTSCTRKGACLLYNQRAFRYRLHGFAIGVKVCAFLMYCVGLYISRSYIPRKEPPKVAENGTAEMERLTQTEEDTKVSQQA